MSNDNMTEEKVSTVSRGDRGELGTATAGLKMRQRWRDEAGGGSLKQFARRLLKEGDSIAKEWFANKGCALNQKRSDTNIKAAKETSMANKAARTKK